MSENTTGSTQKITGVLHIECRGEPFALEVSLDEGPHVATPNSTVEKMEAVVAGCFVWIRVIEVPQEILENGVN